MAKAKNKKPDMERKLCESALRLAARQGWERLSFDQIAQAAKVMPMQARAVFMTKDDIVPGIMRMIDDVAALNCEKPGSNVAPHDRLFEVIMAHFDVLQSHRRAILSIIHAIKCNPRLIRRIIFTQSKTVIQFLQVAGLSPPKPIEPLVITGLIGIYNLALYVWRKDTTMDMSKTMAALDRHLRRGARLAETLFRIYP